MYTFWQPFLCTLVQNRSHPSSADCPSDLVCSSEAWATAVPPGLKCVRPRAHVGLSSGSENMSRCLECLMHRDKDLLDSVDAGRFLTKNYKVLKLVRLRLSIIIKVLEVMSNPRH